MKRLSFLLLMFNFCALAQTTTTTASLPGSLTDCKSTAPVSITVPLANTTSVLVTIISDNINRNSACPPSNINQQAPSFVVTNNTIQIQNNVLLASACTTPNGAQGVNAICIYKTDNNLLQKVTYQYDTTPSLLTTPNLIPGNKQITVSFTDPKAVAATASYSPTYEVCYADETHKALVTALVDTTNNCLTATTSTSTTVTLGNLTNGSTYYVIARVQGSQWTAASSATPINTDGFAEVYNGAPNPLSFGCAQTSGSPGTWMLFLLLGLFLLCRKAENPPQSPFFKGGSKILLIGLLFVSLPAFADLGQMNFSIIGSTYKPNLDASTKSDGSTARPFYGPMFSDKLLPLMGVEVDWHLTDDFGSLQIGLGAAYAYAGGYALKLDMTTLSSDPAGLHMLHLRPQITYLLDSWVDYFPLVPYIRGGIIAAGYIFTYQGGLDKENSANNPIGVIFGYEAAAGLMLALDWMEPRVSKAARANGVYDHIYLKSEIAYMPINNFHQNGLNFSPAWPTQSIPLMLTFGLVFEFK